MREPRGSEGGEGGLMQWRQNHSGESGPGLATFWSEQQVRVVVGTSKLHPTAGSHSLARLLHRNLLIRQDYRLNRQPIRIRGAVTIKVLGRSCYFVLCCSLLNSYLNFWLLALNITGHPGPILYPRNSRH